MEIREIFKRFQTEEIEYVVVGRQACALWGYIVSTRDIDIMVPGDINNIDRLIRVLYGLDYRLVWIPVMKITIKIEDLSDDIINKIKILKFIGNPPIDVIIVRDEKWVGIWKGRCEVDMDGVNVNLMDLDYLIYMKGTSNRKKDIEDAHILKKMKEYYRKGNMIEG